MYTGAFRQAVVQFGHGSAPGRVIEPRDIPDEVRGGRGSAILPATIPRGVGRGGRDDGRDLRPELEFVFRTLVDLRLDMDDLRREFEAYRRETALVALDPGGTQLASRELPVRSVAWDDGIPAAEDLEVVVQEASEVFSTTEPAPPQEEHTVVYRPGMTMEEMEREAIVATLDSVGGNRRKAAELLGIGERTLYRKIAKYEGTPEPD